MNLGDAHKNTPKRTRKFRWGLGKGSGGGKTCGRGGRGQYARSGVSKYPHWEGGQTPLVRKIPKRGFSNARHAAVVVTVNLSDLAGFAAGDVVDPSKLHAAGLIPRAHDYVKVLGGGDLAKALTIKAHAFAGSVQEKAKKAGATLEVIPSDLSQWLEQRAKREARAAAKAAEKAQQKAARKAEREKARAEKKAKHLAGAKAAHGAKKDAKKDAKPAKPKKEGGGGPKPEKKA